MIQSHNELTHEISNEIMGIVNKLIIEDANFQNYDKFNRIEYRPEQEKFFIFSDDTLKVLYKLIDIILEETVEKVGTTKRANFIFDVNYLDKILTDLIIKIKEHNLSLDDINEEITDKLFSEEKYIFFFKIYGIKIKAEKIEFGKFTFFKNVDILKNNIPDKTFLDLTLKGNDFLILQIALDSNGDDERAYFNAYNIANQYKDILSFIGWRFFKKGARIYIDDEFRNTKQTSNYIKNQSVHHRTDINSFHFSTFGVYIDDLVNSELGKQINNFLWKEFESNKSLNAVSWFIKAREENDKVMKMVYLWVAFEAIKGREKSKDKAKEYFKKIYDQSDDKLIDYFYDIRNIIHGSKLRSYYITQLYYDKISNFIYNVLLANIKEGTS